MTSASSAKLTDPFSPRELRRAVADILVGSNYRLFFESVTRRRLIETYRELAKHTMPKVKSDDDWKNRVIKLLGGNDPRLQDWLVGLTNKTRTNLDLDRDALPQTFETIIEEIEENASKSLGIRETALMLWAGAATLTIRGSQKSIVGKTLEKAIARSALSVVGLNEHEGDFRLNLQADAEVQREIDAEVRTNRGTVRIDVGLIGVGNPEVIADKIPRVGSNGVVMFDKLSPRSKVWQTAASHQVRLIQMRNSDPVNELSDHLRSLKVPVCQEPLPAKEIKNRVMKLPLKAFAFSTSSQSTKPRPKPSRNWATSRRKK